MIGNCNAVFATIAPGIPLLCVDRRRFDFFYLELCCALERRLPRYPLWLALCEASPTTVDRGALLDFIDRQLEAFLEREGVALRARTRRQIRRKIASHRPEFSTPCEVMERLCSPLPG